MRLGQMTRHHAGRTSPAKTPHVCSEGRPPPRRWRSLQRHAADRARQLYPILHATGEPKQCAQIFKIHAESGEPAPGSPGEQDLSELALRIRIWELHASGATVLFHGAPRQFSTRTISN